MKAILQTSYGSPDVLNLTEVEKPTPRENQVLVKVHAASINALDYRLMRANPFFVRLMGGGFWKPKDPRIGRDVAGLVEAVGENVTQFRPGDEVFGCAVGSFAEYALAKESSLALKPAGVRFESAAAVPIAALTALQGLRDAGVLRPGQQVLIQGASGGVGTFALQLAKAFGAEVTAVCSPRNLDLARSIGADHVIDYTKEDFTRGEQRYDLIFAANGYRWIGAYKRVLCPQGVYVCAGGTMPQFFQAILLGPRMSEKGGKTLKNMGVAKVTQADLACLGALLETSEIAPVIDACYPLRETAAAVRYVEEKHAQGKVVIRVV
jgi:NADPH:quinone reductase-like Zn-dependent oxidoreductase